MASKFLATAQAVVIEPTQAPTVPPTASLDIDLAKLDDICERLEAEYPRAVQNDATIKGAGLAADGTHRVLYAIQQKGPNGMAVIHASGKLVLSGAMVSFVP